MKILVGGLYHESNTFNPFPTHADHFVVYEGEQMLEKVASTKVFKDHGYEVVPSIFASSLSSGVVTEKAYRHFTEKILDLLKNESDIKGVWLHLHGSMTVDNIGSAELQLLKDIRKIIGSEMPISLTLDIHGNIHPELVEYANIIRSYRTVPHTDQAETETITAKLLVDAIENDRKIKPAFVPVPLILSGEQALGDKEPLVTIFNKLWKLEEIEGISTASYFIGFAWADVEHSTGSVLVIPESEEYTALAEKTAEQLAQYIYDRREDFQFDALLLEPDKAIDKALTADVTPVFISDSGDNTTGGAVGINTSLLRELMSRKELNGKKVCVAAIYDEKAYDALNNYEVGEKVSVPVGIDYDEDSKPIEIEGILKVKGDLMGYLGVSDSKVGDTCTVEVGDIDIVVANKGDSFISINHFKAAGLEVSDYDVVIVKQGYLFPELSELSKLDILALTPGATYQLIEDLEFNHVKRPIYPLDK